MFFFAERGTDITSNKLQRGPQKKQNYSPAPEQLDHAGDDATLSVARRCSNSSLCLGTGASPSRREVADHRSRRIYAGSRRRRHADEDPHLSDLEAGAAILELRHGEVALDSSSELHTRRRRKIHSRASPKHLHRGGRSSPANHHSDRATTLPTPPAGTHAHLDYIQAGIHGFPTLPPPERPPEGEKSGESPAASWCERASSRNRRSLL